MGVVKTETSKNLVSIMALLFQIKLNKVSVLLVLKVPHSHIIPRTIYWMVKFTWRLFCVWYFTKNFCTVSDFQ